MLNKEKKEKYDPTKEMTGKTKILRETFDWVSTFAQALFGVIIVFTFLIRFVTVQGESMLQTLNNGDRLIISDVNYEPERGDIVVIHDPQETRFSGPIIKRVIATEGETVTVDYASKTVSITDTTGKTHLLSEPYINTGWCSDGYVKYDKCLHGWPHPANYLLLSDEDMEDMTVEFKVEEGEVFVCGDNRAHSLDSRYVGTIDERQILGKVLVRIFPNPSLMNHVDYTETNGVLTAEK